MPFLRTNRKPTGSWWRQAARILKADEAQAMTEFVIVIPVVLLVFFAAMQTMVIAQTVQMVNYAAFAAARSYATGYAKFQRDNGPGTDQHGPAEDRAYLVACMAMAPVSTGMNPSPNGSATGEISGSLFALRDPDHPEAVKQTTLEGFAVAYTYRIKNFQATLNGSNDDSTSTVDVTFDYYLPLMIPGLAETWNYLENKPGAGNLQEGEFRARWTSNPGNTRTVGDYVKVLENWIPFTDAGLHSSLVNGYRTYGSQTSTGGAAAVPGTLRIPATCRVGFEPLVGQIRRH